MPATATSRASPSSLPTRNEILGANLERVRARLRDAARAAGRPPEDVRLVAVTKSVDAATTAELARLLLRAGVADLGEQRVDALAAKRAALSEELDAGPPPSRATPDPAHTARWHMIGHLQRNKARRAVSVADVVHSVDTERLLAALARLTDELGRDLDAYLEVELTSIETRAGFAPEGLRALLDGPLELGRVRLRGLMTMAAPDERSRPGDLASQDAARATFASLRRLADALPAERFEGARVELSMGMSDDLEAAVTEGASCVRVGSALFEGLTSPAKPGDGA